MTDYLLQRNGMYYYCRRVPQYVADFDTRRFVRCSLETRDRREALRKSIVHNDFIEEYWRSLIAENGAPDSFSAYKLAVKQAKLFNLTYRTALDISERPLERIIERVSIVADNPEDSGIVEAALGGVVAPSIRLEDCLEQYWQITKIRLVDKSDNQVRKWRNPRKAAFLRFVDTIGGNKAVHDIQRADILKFYTSLRNRIAAQEIIGGTANKSLGYVKDILRSIAIENEIDLPINTLFDELAFKSVQNSRKSFDADYVQDTLLSGNALAGLNREARLLIYAMADTGARESELIGLRPQDIVLDADIPFIWIQPYKGHSLKTPQSHRQIPLVGASLFAFQHLPMGFTHYSNPDTASNTVNKYLRENNLKPSSGHTLYSLRHTFKDRLRDIGAPEEVIDELMGHKSRGPKYGRGHLLEKKHQWLERIAFATTRHSHCNT